MTCPQCEGIEATFDEESIRKELLFYEKDGADDTTLWLTEALKAEDILSASLLDIGGGVGAIQHELLAHGMGSAVHVDGSAAYIEAAKQAAKKRELSEKIEWHHGDFVDIAPNLTKADVVTLDRVICCYHDMPALLGAALKLSKGYIALVYPRDTWYTRFGFRAMNFVQSIFKNPFRAFVHPSFDVEKLSHQNDFRQIFRRQNFIWQVLIYAK